MVAQIIEAWQRVRRRGKSLAADEPDDRHAECNSHGARHAQGQTPMCRRWLPAAFVRGQERATTTGLRSRERGRWQRQDRSWRRAAAAYCGGGVGALGSPEAAARGSGSAGGGVAASGAGLVSVGEVGCSPALAGGGRPVASLKYLKNSEFGAQQHPRVAGLQTLFIGLHGAIETEELGILVDRLQHRCGSAGHRRRLGFARTCRWRRP